MRSLRSHKKTIDLLALKDDDHAGRDHWLLSDLDSSMADSEFGEDSTAIYNYKDVLSWCVSVISESQIAYLMLEEAMKRKWRIALSCLNGSEYCIDVERKLILLDNNALVPSALGRSSYFRNVIIITLVKALRDIWQEKRYGGSDQHYNPHHILVMERLRAADCAVLAILSAWEMRNNNHPEIWRHLLGSDIGDMAMAFSGHLERDITGRMFNYAIIAAFKQWYRADDRVNNCDHATLEYLDDVLTKQSEGENHPFGQKNPSAMNVEMLSLLPDKTAYLQGMGGEILNDPFYAGLDDTVNQSHLMHILYDLEVTVIENVPFRDVELARKIFPAGAEEETTRA